MTRLAFFGELARIQIELKAESFEANSDAEPVIPADRLRRPLNFNVRFSDGKKSQTKEDVQSLRSNFNCHGSLALGRAGLLPASAR